MTREDAISREWLKTAIHNFYYGLKHTPTEEDIQAYIDAAPSVSYSENPNRCEDAVSRQAAIDAFGLSEKTRKYGGDHSGYNTMMLYEIQDMIEDLPSVSTERVGEWIPIDPEQHLFQCSVCGSESTVDTVMYKPTWKYCPNCKAKMEAEE